MSGYKPYHGAASYAATRFRMGGRDVIAVPFRFGMLRGAIVAPAPPAPTVPPTPPPSVAAPDADVRRHPEEADPSEPHAAAGQGGANGARTRKRRSGSRVAA